MGEVSPLIRAIKNGNHQNLLLQGPAGCGKTSLAKTLSDKTEFNWDIQIPVKGKINYQYFGDFPVHVIDEIHKFRNWELLYPYLDDKEETFIFCTTEYGESPEPFLSRCIRLSFDPYSEDHLSLIIQRYSISRRYKLDKECYDLIAQASRGSPRIAKQRFDRVKMMLQFYNHSPNIYWVNHVLTKLGIYDDGYTSEDVRYLEYIKDVGASSILNISRTLRIDKNTIVKEIEPFLLEKGNIEITSKGRKFKTWPSHITMRT
jgi:Holliday junction DNA helicase RuvB